MSLKTVYELNVLVQLDRSIFGLPTRRFDELEAATAFAAYDDALLRGRQKLGYTTTLSTHAGEENSGTVTRVLVELVSYKRGEDWTGTRKVVTRGDTECTEVLELNDGKSRDVSSVKSALAEASA